MLPDYIDAELWAAFVEMRQQMKRVPFTPYAQKLVLQKLERFYEFGYDPNESLRESIQRGWRGVFEQGERQMRDQHGRYRITVEGFREYIQ
jgi:hypothetical protein